MQAKTIKILEEAEANNRTRRDIEIMGRVFTYYPEDSGACLKANDDKSPEMMCPKCFNTWFQIVCDYDHYECKAQCKCGHSFVVYDG